MNTDQHWNFTATFRVNSCVWLLPGAAQVPATLWRTNLLGRGSATAPVAVRRASR